MLYASAVLLAALAGVSQAQSPSNFQPAATQKLDVIFNTTMVNTAGELLTKAATASQPQIAMAGASMTDTYVFVMLDLDVLKQNSKATSASNSTSGTSTRQSLLHCMNTGFKATTQKVQGATLLTSTQKGPATYISPGPPATDIPHRYAQFLFKQPADLQVSATDFSNTTARVGFDLQTFATKNNLGQPLAGNFFMVDGKAGAASGTGAKTTPTPKSTAQPFTGDAVRSDAKLGLAALLGGLAFLI